MKEAREILDRFKLDIDNYDYLCVIQAMIEYAKLAIEKQLKIAADEATVIADPSHYYETVMIVDEESIRNCTRVELK